jgi:hypothetical protein
MRQVCTYEAKLNENSDTDYKLTDTERIGMTVLN